MAKANTIECNQCTQLFDIYNLNIKYFKLPGADNIVALCNVCEKKCNKSLLFFFYKEIKKETAISELKVRILK